VVVGHGSRNPESGMKKLRNEEGDGKGAETELKQRDESAGQFPLIIN